MAPSFIDNRCANTRIDAMRREAPVNRDALVVGLALFAMFFGAGNLISPVHLGQLAGRNVIPAMIGFIITADRKSVV